MSRRSPESYLQKDTAAAIRGIAREAFFAVNNHPKGRVTYNARNVWGSINGAHLDPGLADQAMVHAGLPNFSLKHVNSELHTWRTLGRQSGERTTLLSIPGYPNVKKTNLLLERREPHPDKDDEKYFDLSTGGDARSDINYPPLPNTHLAIQLATAAVVGRVMETIAGKKFASTQHVDDLYSNWRSIDPTLPAPTIERSASSIFAER